MSRRPARSSGPSCLLIGGIGCGVLILGVFAVCGVFTIAGFVGLEQARKQLVEANRLWDAGQKPEAVTIYRHLLTKSVVADDSQEPTVYLRVIEFDAAQGNTDSARQLAEQAIEKGIDLRPEDETAKKLVAEIKAEREKREEAKRKEREEQEKQAETYRQWEKRKEGWEKERQEKIDNPPYTFHKRKSEGKHVMELYVRKEPHDRDALRQLCRDKKKEKPADGIYLLVVFDTKDDATFPTDPITAEFGIEEQPLRHIRAIYVYNHANGYSHLRYSETNLWDGEVKTSEP